jgi:beta propeller repeat protein
LGVVIIKKIIILTGLIFIFVLIFSGAVTAGSDLKSTSITATQAGDTLKITQTIKNQGDTASKETKIYTNLREDEKPIITDPGHQIITDISYNTIVYQDMKSGNWDIWTYNLNSKKKTQITNSPYDEINAKGGLEIVYEIVKSPTNHDIKMYSTYNQKTTDIATSPYSMDCHPDISAATVVWDSDYGNSAGNRDIWMWNLYKPISTKKIISSGTTDAIEPSISGNCVAYQYKTYINSPGDWNIRMYDILHEKQIPICTATGNQANPKLYGDTLYYEPKYYGGIVWEDYRNGNWDVYYYNLGKPVQNGTPISKLPSKQTHPIINDNFIVWEDNRNGNFDIYLYDLEFKIERRITSNSAGQYGPKIGYVEDQNIHSKNNENRTKIFWIEARNGESNNLDIYMGDNYMKNHIPSPVKIGIIGPGQSKTINYSLKLTSEVGKYYVDSFLSPTDSKTYNNIITSKMITLIDLYQPYVTNSKPYDGWTGYPRKDNIIISFNENIFTSTEFNSIKVKNLSTNKYETLTKSISNKTLNIKTNTRTANTWYQVTIPAASVRDQAGNKLKTTYTFKFRTGA